MDRSGGGAEIFPSRVSDTSVGSGFLRHSLHQTLLIFSFLFIPLFWRVLVAARPSARSHGRPSSRASSPHTYCTLILLELELRLTCKKKQKKQKNKKNSTVCNSDDRSQFELAQISRKFPHAQHLQQEETFQRLHLGRNTDI